MNRRLFLGAATAAVSGLLPRSDLFAAKATRPRKILVLGGTNYVGPAIVERALSAGHEVTLFNRGITRPHLFTGVEKLQGDRRMGLKGLKALGGSRSWDAVIDVWPAEEALVGESARLLADRVGYYYFISSIAVYRSFARPWVEESGVLLSSGHETPARRYTIGCETCTRIRKCWHRVRATIPFSSWMSEISVGGLWTPCKTNEQAFSTRRRRHSVSPTFLTLVEWRHSPTRS